jgi:hypothetical protein
MVTFFSTLLGPFWGSREGGGGGVKPGRFGDPKSGGSGGVKSAKKVLTFWTPGGSKNDQKSDTFIADSSRKFSARNLRSYVHKMLPATPGNAVMSMRHFTAFGLDIAVGTAPIRRGGFTPFRGFRDISY